MNANLLNDWPARWAAATPTRLAVTEPGRGLRLTWAELDRSVSALARFLAREAGVGPGDRVAVLAENRIETVVAFFAVARLRAILLPLNHKLAVPELVRVVAQATPKAFLVADALAARGREVIAGTSPLVISFERDFASIVQGPTDGIGPAVVSEDDPWLVLYTSGSTGRPKGALVTHRQIVWNALHTLVACDLGPEDTTVTYTPLFYTGGWNVLSTPIWYRGGCVHLMPQFEAETILRLVARERLTTIFGVPTTLAGLRDHALFPTTDLSSLRVVLVGGASCPPALVDSWAERGILLRQGYGLTEVGPNCFGLKPEDARRKNGAIGRANLHLEWKITDEAGRPVPQGSEGELRLRGPTVFGGYLDDPEATRAALDADGFFKTGDVVRQDEEGHLWVVGRRTDMFKSGGEKVYAGEVEAAIAAHPSVAEVVVLGIPDARWGEVGRAVLVPRPGCGIDGEELRGWLAERIARFKVPKTVVVVDALPRTETGKIARAQVRERWGRASQAALACS